MDAESPSPTNTPSLPTSNEVSQAENISQVPNNIAPEPPPIPKSNLKIIFFVAGLIIIFLMVSALGIFILKSNTKTKNIEPPQQTPQPSLTPGPIQQAPSVDITKIDIPKNWLVYKNNKVGFQVSYPPNYLKTTTTVNEPPYLIETNGLETKDFVIGSDSAKGYLIGIVPAQAGVSLEDFFNGYLALVPQEAKNEFKKEKITIDNTSGLKVSLAGVTTQATFLVNNYFITLNNHLPPSVDPSNEKEFDTMINSLKFQVI